MSIDVSDLRPTIVPKSDQLNSEQLLAGDITVTITHVEATSSKEQPVTIHYEGDDGRPYKPCLTMRKVLIFAWGQDGRAWVGKSLQLYCDESVRFGGSAVGGIRIRAMSHIERDLQISLTATKGKKAAHTIKLLKTAPKAVAADQVQQIIAAVNDGNAAAEAAKLAVMEEAPMNKLWSKLPANVQDALSAAWPGAAA